MIDKEISHKEQTKREKKLYQHLDDWNEKCFFEGTVKNVKDRMISRCRNLLLH